MGSRRGTTGSQSSTQMPIFAAAKLWLMAALATEDWGDIAPDTEEARARHRRLEDDASSMMQAFGEVPDDAQNHDTRFQSFRNVQMDYTAETVVVSWVECLRHATKSNAPVPLDDNGLPPMGEPGENGAPNPRLSMTLSRVARQLGLEFDRLKRLIGALFNALCENKQAELADGCEIGHGVFLRQLDDGYVAYQA